MNYAITGSTGGFGSSALSYLIKSGFNPASLVAVARNEEKANRLKSKGIDVRIGNYDDLKALEKAFQGVDRVLRGEGFSGKTYELSGELWDFKQLAKAAGNIFDKEVNYSPVTVAERKNNLLQAGMDDGTAGFYAALDDYIFGKRAVAFKW
ncbi:MAG: NAD(P)H-binding protein [Spirochaetaceae bacterium]|jgi:uncharacterized protein YbjT (DUF2867 family)|nr:NAD(P)H-binding protein [Spirochaetaceae bacterium]